LDMNLQRHRMGLGIELKVTDPKEVEKIQQRELDITKEKIAKILASGAKVVLTTKGIDDTCLKYFVEAGVLAARRVPLSDLKRLAKATGGSVIVTMADLEGNESLDPTSLGHCTEVQEVRVGDGEILHFLGVQGHGAATIVLRGANEYMLDEMERALHDALSVVKRMLESPTLVAGGGACEAALSVYLEHYATTNPNVEAREQWAILEFAQALLVIPKTLAVNAAKDSSQLVAQLRSLHAKSLMLRQEQQQQQQQVQHQLQQQQKSKDGNNSNESKDEAPVPYKYYGLDLVAGTLRDNVSAGVVEPAMSKIKALRFATEAAITILRIDDRIVVAPDEGEGR
jgi:T-complex protein 1 subunit alpha